jgi:hypothetical protein
VHIVAQLRAIARGFKKAISALLDRKRGGSFATLLLDCHSSACFFTSEMKSIQRSLERTVYASAWARHHKSIGS